ncbi:GNAT family N-acetyltransferase [Streptomyces sp. NP160]|uniref:GNAT family N-acetyltransferase n=1 Tax=Streptomyces sp. NP160 TaxID=2586637 RepID=UPI001117EA65|nr:GNAT family N-acetyltransferase [Streptomyces sp. NP160]TNM64588.1 GNAT family N-acetyltransferase [Streptomyces sp. NP160]
MASRTFAVRRADPADPADLALLLDAVAAAPGGAPVPAQREPLAAGSSAQAAASSAGDVVAALLAHPDVEVLVALSADGARSEVVGLAVLRRGQVVLPAPAVVLHVEQLWVDPAWRRRGVGHQLLAAVAASAEAAGAEDVLAAAATGQRDVQRFLARLGFGRPLVVRSAPLAVLRARLAAAGASGAGRRDRRRAALDELVARRRRQLDRAPG